jgi:hypothetical protein
MGFKLFAFSTFLFILPRCVEFLCIWFQPILRKSWNKSKSDSSLLWVSVRVTRDRCYDFQNIFAEKFAVFCSNYCYFFAKIVIITLVLEKNAIVSPKIGKNRRKLWS